MTRKIKKQTALLKHNQTLYSFRHAGAINVFEKTGSLLKLQQVMGHSDAGILDLLERFRSEAVGLRGLIRVVVDFISC